MKKSQLLKRTGKGKKKFPNAQTHSLFIATALVGLSKKVKVLPYKKLKPGHQEVKMYQCTLVHTQCTLVRISCTLVQCVPVL